MSLSSSDKLIISAPVVSPGRSTKVNGAATAPRVYHFSNGDQYKGGWKNGKIHGKGAYRYANGDVYYGEFMDGEMMGAFCYKYSNGDVFECSWIIINDIDSTDECDRRRRSRRTLNDHGCYRYRNGDTYDGAWRDGAMNGVGVYRWFGKTATADVVSCAHKGYYKDNVRHGKGVFKFSNGDMYDGEFSNGNMHGIGIMRFACGDIYKGTFVDNKISGKGEYRSVNGDVYCCNQWDDSEVNGRGLCRLACGDTYEGSFRHGQRHGRGVYDYFSISTASSSSASGGGGGMIYEGMYEANQKSGYGAYLFPCGSLYVGAFADGLPHGKGILQFADGNIVYEGLFEAGCKTAGTSSIHTDHHNIDCEEVYHKNLSPHIRSDIDVSAEPIVASNE